MVGVVGGGGGRGRLVGDGAGELSSPTGTQPCPRVSMLSVALFMLLGLRQRTYGQQYKNIH